MSNPKETTYGPCPHCGFTFTNPIPASDGFVTHTCSKKGTNQTVKLKSASEHRQERHERLSKSPVHAG